MIVAINGRFGVEKTGVGQVIVNYVKALASVDPRNHYIVFANPEHASLFADIGSSVEVVSNNVKASNVVANHLWSLLCLPIQVRRCRADVLLIPQIALAVFRAAPTVLIQHDLIDQRIPSQEWYRRVFRRFVYRTSFQSAVKIVSVSQNTSEDIKELYPSSAAKVTTILNGVTPGFSSVPDDSDKVVVERVIGCDASYLLYVGTITHPQKNLVRLVEAYAEARARVEKHVPRLVLVGKDGKDAWRVRSAIKAHGVEESIQLVGYVPDSIVHALMRRAVGFIFVSQYEGFGLPVVEAMSSGTPVITSSNSSLSEVSGGATLLVDPSNATAIADAIVRLCIDPALREGLRAKGLERVKHMSWARSAEQLLGVLREAAGAAGNCDDRNVQV